MRKIAYRVLGASPVVYGAMMIYATAVRADNCSDPSDCQAVPGNVDWTTGLAISGVFMLICWRLLGPRLTRRPGPPPAVPLPHDHAHAAHEPEHVYGSQWDARLSGAAAEASPGYLPSPPPSLPSDQPSGQVGYQGGSGADFTDRQARPVDTPGAPGDRGRQSFGAPGDRGHDAFGVQQGNAPHDLARPSGHPEAVQQPAPPHAGSPEAVTTTSDPTGHPSNVQHTPPGATSEARQQGQVPDTGRQQSVPPTTSPFEHAQQDAPGTGSPRDMQHGEREAGGAPERQQTGAPGEMGNAPPRHSPATGSPPGVPVENTEAANPHDPVRKPGEEGKP